MTVYSLLYASKSTIPPDEAEAAVETLVTVSRLRNLDADVTGCLIFGGSRFAQILEGEQMAVEHIMRSISRDTRHSEVTVLNEGPANTRRFAGWALGYAGPSLFVQRSILKPVTEALRGSQNGIADLVHMMTTFHAEQGANLG